MGKKGKTKAQKELEKRKKRAQKLKKQSNYTHSPSGSGGPSEQIGANSVDLSKLPPGSSSDAIQSIHPKLIRLYQLARGMLPDPKVGTQQTHWVVEKKSLKQAALLLKDIISDRSINDPVKDQLAERGVSVKGMKYLLAWPELRRPGPRIALQRTSLFFVAISIIALEVHTRLVITPEDEVKEDSLDVVRSKVLNVGDLTYDARETLISSARALHSDQRFAKRSKVNQSINLLNAILHEDNARFLNLRLVREMPEIKKKLEQRLADIIHKPESASSQHSADPIYGLVLEVLRADFIFKARDAFHKNRIYEAEGRLLADAIYWHPNTDMTRNAINLIDPEMDQYLLFFAGGNEIPQEKIKDMVINSHKLSRLLLMAGPRDTSFPIDPASDALVPWAFGLQERLQKGVCQNCEYREKPYSLHYELTHLNWITYMMSEAIRNNPWHIGDIQLSIVEGNEFFHVYTANDDPEQLHLVRIDAFQSPKGADAMSFVQYEGQDLYTARNNVVLWVNQGRFETDEMRNTIIEDNDMLAVTVENAPHVLTVVTSINELWFGKKNGDRASDHEGSFVGRPILTLTDYETFADYVLGSERFSPAKKGAFKSKSNEWALNYVRSFLGKQLAQLKNRPSKQWRSVQEYASMGYVENLRALIMENRSKFERGGFHLHPVMATQQRLGTREDEFFSIERDLIALGVYPSIFTLQVIYIDERIRDLMGLERDGPTQVSVSVVQDSIKPASDIFAREDSVRRYSDYLGRHSEMAHGAESANKLDEVKRRHLERFVSHLGLICGALVHSQISLQEKDRANEPEIGFLDYLGKTGALRVRGWEGNLLSLGLVRVAGTYEPTVIIRSILYALNRVLEAAEISWSDFLNSDYFRLFVGAYFSVLEERLAQRSQRLISEIAHVSGETYSGDVVQQALVERNKQLQSASIENIKHDLLTLVELNDRGAITNALQYEITPAVNAAGLSIEDEAFSNELGQVHNRLNELEVELQAIGETREILNECKLATTSSDMKSIETRASERLGRNNLNLNDPRLNEELKAFRAMQSDIQEDEKYLATVGSDLTSISDGWTESGDGTAYLDKLDTQLRGRPRPLSIDDTRISAEVGVAMKKRDELARQEKVIEEAKSVCAKAHDGMTLEEIDSLQIEVDDVLVRGKLKPLDLRISTEKSKLVNLKHRIREENTRIETLKSQLTDRIVGVDNSTDYSRALHQFNTDLTSWNSTRAKNLPAITSQDPRFGSVVSDIRDQIELLRGQESAIRRVVDLNTDMATALSPTDAQKVIAHAESILGDKGVKTDDKRVSEQMDLLNRRKRELVDDEEFLTNIQQRINDFYPTATSVEEIDDFIRELKTDLAERDRPLLIGDPRIQHEMKALNDKSSALEREEGVIAQAIAHLAEADGAVSSNRKRGLLEQAEKVLTGGNISLTDTRIGDELSRIRSEAEELERVEAFVKEIEELRKVDGLPDAMLQGITHIISSFNERYDQDNNVRIQATSIASTFNSIIDAVRKNPDRVQLSAQDLRSLSEASSIFAGKAQGYCGNNILSQVKSNNSYIDELIAKANRGYGEATDIVKGALLKAAEAPDLIVWNQFWGTAQVNMNFGLDIHAPEIQDALKAASSHKAELEKRNKILAEINTLSTNAGQVATSGEVVDLIAKADTLLNEMGLSSDDDLVVKPYNALEERRMELLSEERDIQNATAELRKAVDAAVSASEITGALTRFEESLRSRSGEAIHVDDDRLSDIVKEARGRREDLKKGDEVIESVKGDFEKLTLSSPDQYDNAIRQAKDRLRKSGIDPDEDARTKAFFAEQNKKKESLVKRNGILQQAEQIKGGSSQKTPILIKNMRALLTDYNNNQDIDPVLKFAASEVSQALAVVVNRLRDNSSGVSNSILSEFVDESVGFLDRTRDYAGQQRSNYPRMRQHLQSLRPRSKPQRRDPENVPSSRDNDPKSKEEDGKTRNRVTDNSENNNGDIPLVLKDAGSSKRRKQGGKEGGKSGNSRRSRDLPSEGNGKKTEKQKKKKLTNIPATPLQDPLAHTSGAVYEAIVNTPEAAALSLQAKLDMEIGVYTKKMERNATFAESNKLQEKFVRKLAKIRQLTEVATVLSEIEVAGEGDHGNIISNGITDKDNLGEIRGQFVSLKRTLPQNSSQGDLINQAIDAIRDYDNKSSARLSQNLNSSIDLGSNPITNKGRQFSAVVENLSVADKNSDEVTLGISENQNLSFNSSSGARMMSADGAYIMFDRHKSLESMIGDHPFEVNLYFFATKELLTHVEESYPINSHLSVEILELAYEREFDEKTFLNQLLSVGLPHRMFIGFLLYAIDFERQKRTGDSLNYSSIVNMVKQGLGDAINSLDMDRLHQFIEILDDSSLVRADDAIRAIFDHLRGSGNYQALIQYVNHVGLNEGENPRQQAIEDFEAISSANQIQRVDLWVNYGGLESDVGQIRVVLKDGNELLIAVNVALDTKRSAELIRGVNQRLRQHYSILPDNVMEVYGFGDGEIPVLFSEWLIADKLMFQSESTSVLLARDLQKGTDRENISSLRMDESQDVWDQIIRIRTNLTTVNHESISVPVADVDSGDFVLATGKSDLEFQVILVWDQSPLTFENHQWGRALWDLMTNVTTLNSDMRDRSDPVRFYDSPIRVLQIIHDRWEPVIRPQNSNVGNLIEVLPDLLAYAREVQSHPGQILPWKDLKTEEKESFNATVGNLVDYIGDVVDGDKVISSAMTWQERYQFILDNAPKVESELGLGWGFEQRSGVNVNNSNIILINPFHHEIDRGNSSASWKNFVNETVKIISIVAGAAILREIDEDSGGQISDKISNRLSHLEGKIRKQLIRSPLSLEDLVETYSLEPVSARLSFSKLAHAGTYAQPNISFLIQVFFRYLTHYFIVFLVSISSLGKNPDNKSNTSKGRDGGRGTAKELPYFESLNLSPDQVLKMIQALINLGYEKLQVFAVAHSEQYGYIKPIQSDDDLYESYSSILEELKISLDDQSFATLIVLLEVHGFDVPHVIDILSGSEDQINVALRRAVALWFQKFFIGIESEDDRDTHLLAAASISNSMSNLVRQFYESLESNVDIFDFVRKLNGQLMNSVGIFYTIKSDGKAVLFDMIIDNSLKQIAIEIPNHPRKRFFLIEGASLSRSEEVLMGVNISSENVILVNKKPIVSSSMNINPSVSFEGFVFDPKHAPDELPNDKELTLLSSIVTEFLTYGRGNHFRYIFINELINILEPEENRSREGHLSAEIRSDLAAIASSDNSSYFFIGSMVGAIFNGLGSTTGQSFVANRYMHKSVQTINELYQGLLKADSEGRFIADLSIDVNQSPKMIVRNLNLILPQLGGMRTQAVRDSILDLYGVRINETVVLSIAGLRSIALERYKERFGNEPLTHELVQSALNIRQGYYVSSDPWGSQPTAFMNLLRTSRPVININSPINVSISYPLFDISRQTESFAQIPEQGFTLPSSPKNRNDSNRPLINESFARMSKTGDPVDEFLEDLSVDRKRAFAEAIHSKMHVNNPLKPVNPLLVIFHSIRAYQIDPELKGRIVRLIDRVGKSNVVEFLFRGDYKAHKLASTTGNLIRPFRTPGIIDFDELGTSDYHHDVMWDTDSQDGGGTTDDVIWNVIQGTYRTDATSIDYDKTSMHTTQVIPITEGWISDARNRGFLKNIVLPRTDFIFAGGLCFGCFIRLMYDIVDFKGIFGDKSAFHFYENMSVNADSVRVRKLNQGRPLSVRHNLFDPLMRLIGLDKVSKGRLTRKVVKNGEPIQSLSTSKYPQVIFNISDNFVDPEIEIQLREDEFDPDQLISRTDFRDIAAEYLATDRDANIIHAIDATDNGSDRKTFSNARMSELKRDSVETPYEYFILNKPKRVLSSRDDVNSGLKSIYDIFAEKTGKDPDEFYSLGRLDKSTSGLIIMTDDPSMMITLMPGAKASKVYEVKSRRRFVARDVQKLIGGVEITKEIRGATGPERKRREIARADRAWLSRRGSIYIEIHEGGFHHVRKMIAALGYKRYELSRTQYGSLQLSRFGIKKGEVKKIGGDQLQRLLEIKSNAQDVLRASEEENLSRLIWGYIRQSDMGYTPVLEYVIDELVSIGLKPGNIGQAARSLSLFLSNEPATAYGEPKRYVAREAVKHLSAHHPNRIFKNLLAARDSNGRSAKSVNGVINSALAYLEEVGNGQLEHAKKTIRIHENRRATKKGKKKFRHHGKKRGSGTVSARLPIQTFQTSTDRLEKTQNSDWAIGVSPTTHDKARINDGNDLSVTNSVYTASDLYDYFIQVSTHRQGGANELKNLSLLDAKYNHVLVFNILFAADGHLQVNLKQKNGPVSIIDQILPKDNSSSQASAWNQTYSVHGSLSDIQMTLAMNSRNTNKLYDSNGISGKTVIIPVDMKLFDGIMYHEEYLNYLHRSFLSTHKKAGGEVYFELSDLNHPVAKHWLSLSLGSNDLDENNMYIVDSQNRPVNSIVASLSAADSMDEPNADTQLLFLMNALHDEVFVDMEFVINLIRAIALSVEIDENGQVFIGSLNKSMSHLFGELVGIENLSPNDLLQSISMKYGQNPLIIHSQFALPSQRVNQVLRMYDRATSRAH